MTRDTPVAITATYNGDTHSKILTLQGPKISSLSVPSPAGEGTVTGTVRLTFSVPSYPSASVSLSSSDSYTVRILSGGSIYGSSASLGIRIVPRPYDVTARIRASYNGSSAEATIFVPRAYKPDLYLHAVSFTDWIGSAITAPTADRAWRAHVTVANRGNAASPQTRLKVTVLDGAGTAAAGGYVTLPPLAEGTGITLTYSQPTLPAGGYRLVIEVDPDKSVVEFNEYDNEWRLDF